MPTVSYSICLGYHHKEDERKYIPCELDSVKDIYTYVYVNKSNKMLILDLQGVVEQGTLPL